MPKKSEHMRGYLSILLFIGGDTEVQTDPAAEQPPGTSASSASSIPHGMDGGDTPPIVIILFSNHDQSVVEFTTSGMDSPSAQPSSRANPGACFVTQ